MSRDKEIKSNNKTDKLHLLLAIRRKKENENLRDEPELCFRKIVRNLSSDIEQLKTKISNHKGTWRIYHTVNSRDTNMARKLLMQELIKCPENWDYRIDSLWKTCLLQSECKAEKNFLIDIDSKSNKLLDSIARFIKLNDGTIYIQKETPNGYHLISSKFDTREFTDTFKNVEIKRDGYIFIEKRVI